MQWPMSVTCDYLSILWLDIIMILHHGGRSVNAVKNKKLLRWSQSRSSFKVLCCNERVSIVFSPLMVLTPQYACHTTRHTRTHVILETPQCRCKSATKTLIMHSPLCNSVSIGIVALGDLAWTIPYTPPPKQAVIPIFVGASMSSNVAIHWYDRFLGCNETPHWRGGGKTSPYLF